MLACSAAGLIPLSIGIGFFVDYRLQARELAHFGLEVGAEWRSCRPDERSSPVDCDLVLVLWRGRDVRLGCH